MAPATDLLTSAELDNRAARPKKTDRGLHWVILGYAFGYGQLINLGLGLVFLAGTALTPHGGTNTALFGLWLTGTAVVSILFDLEAVRASCELEDQRRQALASDERFPDPDDLPLVADEAGDRL